MVIAWTHILDLTDVFIESTSVDSFGNCPPQYIRQYLLGTDLLLLYHNRSSVSRILVPNRAGSKVTQYVSRGRRTLGATVCIDEQLGFLRPLTGS